MRTEKPASKKTTSTFKRPSSSLKGPSSKGKFKKKTNNKAPKFGKKTRLEKLNTHINFSRESEKTNARKWPTEVICCQCRQKFILPFKPRDPEVYCDHCFNLRKKHNKIKRKYDELN